VTPLHVRVPATSANLGPGFDALGLALARHDDVWVQPRQHGCHVHIEGEGAGDVPTDERHLVVRALRAGLEHAGVAQPGLELRSVNRIPHGRGLGSSAAATVAGLLLARALVGERAPDRVACLDDEAVLGLATTMEGHPDNVAACLLGGATVAWTSHRPQAVRLPVHEGLHAVVLVPDSRLATARARGLLPEVVPHADAVFNVARAALLVAALGTGSTALLHDATADRLHQEQRRPAMPESLALVDRIRESGGAAAVSGAGPSVLVLGVGDLSMPTEAVPATGWQVWPLAIDRVGAVIG
jgi:homoserine kinase